MSLDNCVGKSKEFEIKIDKEIGKGNFGKVFICENKTNRQLSLCAKVVQISESIEKNQKREKEIAELISKNLIFANQNLVQTYHVEIKQQNMIFIMEKCDSNLQKVIDDKLLQFNQQVIDDFLKQFLNGYLFLYNNNIVHRDIKPDNILIKYESNKKTNPIYKIADFGVGKIYKSNEFKMTKTGTPVFAAPEINVIYQDKDLEAKFQDFSKQEKSKSCVDIFSLGIILYKIVYGDYPFKASPKGIQEFLNKIKVTPLTLPNNYYKNLIEGMLKYYPDQRLNFKNLFDIYNIKFQSFQNQFKNQNQQNQYQNQNFQNGFQNQNQLPNKFPFQNQNQNQSTQFNANGFQNQSQNQQVFQQANQTLNLNTQVNPQQSQNGISFSQQVGQNFTNFTINFKQSIFDYFQLLLIENEKILIEEFKQGIQSITSTQLITQPLIPYLKGIYFPVKTSQIDSYRQEHLKFLYSISQLSKNFFAQPKGTNINEIKSYLKDNPF